MDSFDPDEGCGAPEDDPCGLVLNVSIEWVEQADAVASALEGQVVEVASRLYSLRCLGQGTQEPSQGSDPITAVWQVTGVGTAPGMKVSSANLPVANKTDTQ